MHKSLGMAAGAAALLLVMGGPAKAQSVQCVGDCSNSGTVEINEIITCVNIGLDLLPLSTCDKCDQNMDGTVTINEIITAVNEGLELLPCPAVDGAICGNNIVETGEDCDDGNNFGGDGCAKNCTNETKRSGDFDPNKATSLVQTAVIPIQLFLSGSQALITGQPRDTAVMDPEGNTVTKANEVPVVIKAADVKFAPRFHPRPGLCLRARHRRARSVRSRQRRRRRHRLREQRADRHRLQPDAGPQHQSGKPG